MPPFFKTYLESGFLVPRLPGIVIDIIYSSLFIELRSEDQEILFRYFWKLWQICIIHS
jgi:hypothetical protein